jgi:sugar (pentulose or hexulose) kinase
VSDEYLGLDLGTTTFKGAVLDLNRRLVRNVQRVPAPPCVAGLAPNQHELDTEVVLHAVERLLRHLLSVAPDADGLILCGQMHGLVFTDERGRACSNVITWKDQRAATYTSQAGEPVQARLEREVSLDERRQIGGELRVGVPITTLSALRDSGLLPHARYAVSLVDFVVARLGETAPTTHSTNAAAHGLFHLERRAWHDDLIARLGLAGLLWPDVRPTGACVGSTAIGGREMRVFVPVGDQQCALLGAGLRERELSLNLSTGGQASLIASDSGSGDFLIRPYFDESLLRTIVSLPAGRTLQVLVDLVTELGDAPTDSWQAIRDAVERVPEPELEVDLSFFEGSTGRHGSIGNIREENLSVGHLFAAAFRSMAREYARAVQRLSPRREWDRVIFSGGLAQRWPRLRQETLAALGTEAFRVSTTEEETLRGLLVLALVCDGRAGSVQEASRMVADGD